MEHLPMEDCCEGEEKDLDRELEAHAAHVDIFPCILDHGVAWDGGHDCASGLHDERENISPHEDTCDEATIEASDGLRGDEKINEAAEDHVYEGVEQERREGNGEGLAGVELGGELVRCGEGSHREADCFPGCGQGYHQAEELAVVDGEDDMS